mmetsp:Transcript_114684/g.228202  ORF Transcript_114684/g.228202 Transcript_114684/m.228202 type:complete len:303 (+) Transcript_114684:438-1346(+)
MSDETWMAQCASARSCGLQSLTAVAMKPALCTSEATMLRASVLQLCCCPPSHDFEADSTPLPANDSEYAECAASTMQVNRLRPARCSCTISLDCCWLLVQLIEVRLADLTNLANACVSARTHFAHCAPTCLLSEHWYTAEDKKLPTPESAPTMLAASAAQSVSLRCPQSASASFTADPALVSERVAITESMTQELDPSVCSASMPVCPRAEFSATKTTLSCRVALTALPCTRASTTTPTSTRANTERLVAPCRQHKDADLAPQAPCCCSWLLLLLLTLRGLSGAFLVRRQGPSENRFGGCWG